MFGLDALGYALSWLIGATVGWFARRFYVMRGMASSTTPTEAYTVRIAMTTRDGPVSKQLYAGDDLTLAKEAFKFAAGPKSSLVELYTRGNHTASRRI